jgi:hypothetical protein
MVTPFDVFNKEKGKDGNIGLMLPSLLVAGVAKLKKLGS